MTPGAWYFVFDEYRAGRVFTFDSDDARSNESLDDDPLGLGGSLDDDVETVEAEEKAEERGCSSIETPSHWSAGRAPTETCGSCEIGF